MKDNQTIFQPGMRIHCVGIGGIGVSAVARWLQSMNLEVTGEDRTASDITTRLEQDGIPVSITEEGKLHNVDIVVYSDAVPDTYQTLLAARENDIPCYSFSKALGILTTDYTTIAVAGTHGKSTTTALIGLLLEAAGVDPTVMVGTLVPQWGNTNFRAGKGNVAVVEADEHNRHFLELHPDIAVVTNVDFDHVDVFTSLEEYVHAFQEFIGLVPPDGTVILNALDPATETLKSNATATTRTFEGRTNSIWKNGGTDFELLIDNESKGEFRITVPGDHMIMNAAAACAAVDGWNIDPSTIIHTLENFHGTWRRFEHVGQIHGAEVISDYAHHPTEITALLQAAKSYAPNKRIILVFQPHHYARTTAFANEFIHSFCGAQQVILSEMYSVPGRSSDANISVKDWVPQIEKQCGIKVQFCPTLSDTESAIRTIAKKGDLVLITGAGNIDIIARNICT